MTTPLVTHLRGELQELNTTVKALRFRVAEQDALLEAFEARVKISVPRKAVATELRRLLQGLIDGTHGNEALFDFVAALETGLFPHKSE